MFEIDKKTRDDIVAALQVQMVPAICGGVLMQVVDVLKNLKEIKEEKCSGSQSTETKQ